MKRALLAAAVGAALAAGGYIAGRHSVPAGHAQPEAGAAPVADARKPLYWHDPMYPQQKFDKPGKSPFMDMQLVPVYADDKDADAGVTVSARARQNLGVRTAAAEVRELRQELAAVGTVQFDERRVARAEVRAQGWVERLHVRAVNDPVRASRAALEVYSPDLVAAQEEYLLARRMAGADAADAPLAAAARRRLAALGLPEPEIAALEARGEARRRVPVLAPISGVLIELGVREGAMVQAGMPAFVIGDLSSVWLSVEVPEAQAAVLRPGLRAVARSRAEPGRAVEGRVDYVYPELNPQTRTARARISVANPGGALRPGMFVDVTLAAAARKALAVPSEAVIATGARTVVIVKEGDRFRAASVTTGAERDGWTEVTGGLREGETVVASGQFLIDSEASLKGVLDRLAAPNGPATADAAHAGRGKVTAVDAARGRIELDHEPIAALKWPRMTMEFAVEDKAALADLKPGDSVEFEMRAAPDKAGDYVLRSLRRSP